MNKKSTETPDALIDQVREVRRRLVAKHGGLRQWVKHLQDRQKEHPGELLSSPKRVGKLPA